MHMPRIKIFENLQLQTTSPRLNVCHLQSGFCSRFDEIDLRGKNVVSSFIFKGNLEPCAFSFLFLFLLSRSCKNVTPMFECLSGDYSPWR